MEISSLREIALWPVTWVVAVFWVACSYMAIGGWFEGRGYWRRQREIEARRAAIQRQLRQWDDADAARLSSVRDRDD